MRYRRRARQFERHLRGCYSFFLNVGHCTGEVPMQDPGVERRLAAILAADVVGYSRLMEVDETGTLARLKTHRLELIDPAIAKNRGRIIKTTGDGLLVEFQSVTDAVQCAAEIQRRMARRNSDVSPARMIQFRIGINVGDVIVEGTDIFGDGVNIAARMEAIEFGDLGEKTLKNIARPVRVFRVVLDPERARGSDAAPAAKTAPRCPSI